MHKFVIKFKQKGGILVKSLQKRLEFAVELTWLAVSEIAVLNIVYLMKLQDK